MASAAHHREDEPLKRKVFYDAIRAKLFGGDLVQTQVDGIEAVLRRH